MRVPIVISVVFMAWLSGCVSSESEGPSLAEHRQLVAQLSAVETNLTAREAELASKTKELARVETELERLRSEHRTKVAAYDRLFDEKRALVSERDAYQQGLSRTKALLDATAASASSYYAGTSARINGVEVVGSESDGYDVNVYLDPLMTIRTAALDDNAVFIDPEIIDASDSVYCTGSMKPTLDCGDVVLTYMPSETELNVGDIVTYLIPETDPGDCYFKGRAIIHRIVAVEAGTDGVVRYALRGDANSVNDDCLIPWGMVTGKVFGIIYDSRV